MSKAEQFLNTNSGAPASSNREYITVANAREYARLYHSEQIASQEKEGDADFMLMGKVAQHCKISIGEKRLSKFMYAIIMCKASVKTTHGVGIYDLTRGQNTGHRVDMLIYIAPKYFQLFEHLSGCELQEPLTVRCKTAPPKP